MKKVYSIFVCLCMLAGFVACDKDQDFALTTLTVTNETVTPSYETAEVSCSFKADATISEAYVQYSLSSSFADYEVAKMTEEKGRYTALLTGLVDNTTYYIRYTVSNKFSNVVADAVEEFQTLSCTVPTIVLDSIGGVRESHAKAYLHLTFDGGASVTDMGICWSTEASPTIEDIHKSTKDTAAVLDITNLQENTKYYVRAYAVNKVGTAYSDEQVFTTYALPEVRTEEVTDIQVNTALLSAILLFDGNDTATVKGFCWSDKAEPTIDGNHIAIDTTSAHYTYILSDLLPTTEYHVRAYAQNKIGLVYGEEKTFTTTKEVFSPTVTTATITQITETTAVAGGDVTSDGNADVTERGVCISTVSNPTTSNTKVTSGNGTGAFTCNLTDLQPNTKYYVRAYAVNEKGTAYGEEVNFTTSKQVVIPIVTTSSVTQITEMGAVVGGNVTGDGGASVTERGVVYSTNPNPVITNLSNTIRPCGSGMGEFTYTITGLQPSTKYYVRAYAKNDAGTAYGEEVSFTTLSQQPTTQLPTVTTSVATQITATTAVAGGNVTSEGGASVTERGVCIATISNPTTANTKIPAGSGTGEFTCEITGLQEGTKYYIRAYAVNSEGTAYGDEEEFTTAVVTTPTLTTSEVTQITETSAVAGGNVTSDGNASVTERGVVYSLSATPAINDLSSTIVRSGSGTGVFTCNLTNLQSGTKYFVRAYAVNDKGTAYGEVVSFTTAVPITLATVTTATVSNITENTAVAGGAVTNDGNSSVTDRGVCIATVSNPTTAHTKISAGSGMGTFTCNLTGLQANTKYYIRAYAVNSKGTAYGEELTFTTAKPIVLPTVTTDIVTQISVRTAVAGGNVTSDGNASVTERGVCVATASNPTTSNTKITSGSGTGSFTCNLTGLQPSTTYYVRAYAINSKGTAYGEEVSFTTEETSTPTIPPTDGAIVFDADVDKGNAGTDINIASAYQVSKSGVTMEVSKGILGTYNNETHYRIYKSQTLTLTSTIGKIEKVEVTCTANDANIYGPGCFIVASGDYTYADYVGTWIGSADEITFTASTNQVRVTQIIVTIDNGNGTENGHEYVDLGLSVKWATMNVGASSPEDYGDYFAWGEIEPKEVYDWSTYKWCNGSEFSLIKYNTNSSYGTVDNKTQLELSDDAAYMNWGGAWRMPTDAELTELREQCTWTWATQNGVNGYKVIGSNGNSIFLPAAGFRRDSSLYHAGSYGDYWSSSLTDSSGSAWGVYFYSGSVNREYRSCGFGRPVRPVCQ